MSCLHRQNSMQCKFRRWAIFLHGVCCKNCKNFCLLPAVFSSRSFDYVVFTQAKLCAMQVSQVDGFAHSVFLCSNNRQMFCNCKPSVGFVGFVLSFSAKNSCILFCNFVLVPFVDLKVCVCCFLRCVWQSSSALNFKT